MPQTPVDMHNNLRRSQNVTKSKQYGLIMQPIAKNSSKNFIYRGFLTYFEEL
jgi:hypothetical protein